MGSIDGIKVTFDSLYLEGFGVYREAMKFKFSPGINVFAAPNETGKTSMIAGLTAVIFGLSHRQGILGAGVFNLNRFRNWDNPAVCRGELVFTSQGVKYVITRDFDTHRISLRKIEGTGDKHISGKVLVEGQHNPEARKPLEGYDEYLLDILGINGAELFHETFFVTQPLPETESIGADLQGLLSGSKGASFQEALENLRSNLKNITKYTGHNDRGVTARSMGRDGSLEQIRQKKMELATAINAGRESADSLIKVQIQYGNVEENLKKKRELLKNKTRVKEAWTTWRLLSNQYSESAEERDRLKKASDEALLFTERRSNLLEIVENEYKEFSGAPDLISDYLNELIELKKRVEEQKASINKVKGENDGYLIRNKELSDALDGYSKWIAFGSEPAERIRGIRREAAAAIKSWKKFQADMDRLNMLYQQIEKRFRIFQDATEDEIKAITSYKQIITELSSEVMKAEHKFETATQQLDDYREAKADYCERYRDINDLTPDIAAKAAEEKSLLLKEMHELKDRAALQPGVRNKQKKVTALISIAAGILISAAIGFYLVYMAYGIAVVVPAITFVFITLSSGTYLIFRSFNKSTASKMLISDDKQVEINAKIAETNKYLGTFSEADEIKLARLSERLKQMKDENRRLQDKSERINGIDITSLDSQLKKAMQKEHDYLDLTKKFTDVYGNEIQSSLNEWRELEQEKHRLKTETGNWSASILGCEQENASKADTCCEKMNKEWRELAVFINNITSDSTSISPNAVTATSADNLMKCIESIDELKWQELESTAEKITEMRKESELLEQRLEDCKKRIKEEEDRVKKYCEKISEYTKLLKQVLEANDYDPGLSLTRFTEYKERISAIEKIDGDLDRLLKSHSAVSVSDLGKKHSLSIDLSAGRMIKWQDHIDKYPGLPVPSDVEDVEKIQIKIQEIDNEIETAEKEIGELEEQRTVIFRHLARLEGENPINIAVAELELDEINAIEKDLLLQADAYTEAYKELDLAINEYRQTYKQRLEDKATACCCEVSLTKNRKVVFDDHLNLAIIENGRPITAYHLSKGARDQVYLSIRFAIANMLSDNCILPMIFDDPFTSTDSKRLEMFRHIMEKEGENRQIILLAHSDSYNGWGRSIAIERQPQSID